MVAKGHEVIFGVRDPDKPAVRELVSSLGSHCCAASVREAAEPADIVVLAVPWSAARDAISAAGNLTGKILIDVTNPIDFEHNRLAVGLDTSAAEQISAWAKGASVVKALNTVWYRLMAEPRLNSECAKAFIGGDDPEAKTTVARLIDDLGLDVCDTGPLYHARYLEPLAMLYVDMVRAQGREPHFAVVRCGGTVRSAKGERQWRE